MPANTTDGYTYPLGTEAIKDGAAAIQTLAQQVNDRFVKDLAANRPAFGKPGRRFYATDTGQWSVDIGTGWKDLAPGSGQGLASARPAIGTVPLGYEYTATDLGDVSKNIGGAWVHAYSTARVKATASGASRNTGLMEFPTALSGSSIFTLATQSSQTNSRINAPAGVYDWSIAATMGASLALVGYVVDSGGTQKRPATFTSAAATSHGIAGQIELATGDGLIFIIAGSGGANTGVMTAFNMQRVSP